MFGVNIPEELMDQNIPEELINYNNITQVNLGDNFSDSEDGKIFAGLTSLVNLYNAIWNAKTNFENNYIGNK